VSLVRIPFRPFFRDTMLSGVKICTSRPYPMAQAGDHFYAFGKTFEVVAVHTELLGYIANNLWKEEGVASPAEFVAVWNSIHYFKGYRPNWLVYLHWFNLYQ